MTDARRPQFNLARVRPVGGDGDGGGPAEIVPVLNPPAGTGPSRRAVLGTGVGAAVLLGLAARGAIAQDRNAGGPVATFYAHRYRILGLAFARDGRHLASVDEYGGAKLWRLGTGPGPAGGLLHTLAQPSSTGGRGAGVAISPDGRVVALGGVPMEQVRLFNVADGKPLPPLAGHPEGGAGQVAFLPDGRTLVSQGCPPDATMRLWSLPDGKLLQSVPDPLATALAVSPDGRSIASGGAGGGIRRWTLPGLRERGQLHPPAAAVGAAAFGGANALRLPLLAFVGPLGRQLASGGADGSVCVASMTDDKLVVRVRLDAAAAALAASPDGRLLATGCEGRSGVTLWSLPAGTAARVLDADPPNPNPPAAPKPGPGRPPRTTGRTPTALAFSPNGRLLAAGIQGQIKLFALPDGREVGTLTDPAANDAGVLARTYEVRAADGSPLTFTAPSAAAVPAGATCTCDTVNGSFRPIVVSGGGGGGGALRCVCVPVSL